MHRSRPRLPPRYPEFMEEEVLGKAYDGRLMRRLLGYMRPYGLLVGLSLVFLLMQSVLRCLARC